MNTDHDATALEEDHLAVHEAFDRVMAAWGEDADAYGAGFTRDASYVVWFGARYRGRAEIVEQHRPLFAGPMRGSRLVGRIEDVQFIHDDVAVVTSWGAIVRGRRTGRHAGRHGRKLQTWVAVRSDDRWRFAAFVNTKRRPLIETIAARAVPARSTEATNADPLRKGDPS
ncbi:MULTISPECIES: SgcJ/EcaC family oxidoreductase [unclassified Pseudactinotalea]|uniref:SgcJ/EcaC family oxidoreductase n=1 Tax=unclassified Pseudactinotalea TaxID=2649176 RepID=UPI00128D73E7|nr:MULTISPECIES: SgcJ/EcaC family oxidoreductase [unclassified Pseudactinotalea]MPV51243.1 SgcJ/EcaC family oxidoreductase [Pseudactinotalea sp. HY160]QGH69673.1 SgcJ/EcaC family oxidoreductase [Pseudactinotalea sp. HY158]